LRATLEQRADHNEFEQLANSEVVQQERRTLQAETHSQTGSVPDWVFMGTAVNNGQIKTIYWREGWEVGAIDTLEGKSLSRGTVAPSAWLYPLFALFPFLGFFIPWGAIRAIGWVGAGFSQPSH
jgi:hypothetical protein